ncbi:MAG: DNA-processing protein DprA [Curvibacter sp.]|jgi:predicted Rossmann fold nucleotide-binding protein DprA/Smf involved in DNA uptake|nr:DNA-processing protein DprA [Curvibacter sp.]
MSALWHLQGRELLTGRGARALLDLELTAFFASRQCPGTAIRAAMDWALQQASAKRAIISGFHSPLEQSVLTVLMAAGSPTVVVLARPVQDAKLPPEWHDPLAHRRMAVISGVDKADRLTQQSATERNALVVRLAHSVVVAHASPTGSLAAQMAQWRQEGRRVAQLVAP